MLFHSVSFLVFFCIFLLGLNLFRGVLRTPYVAVASCVFYAWWYPPYLAFLFGLTIFAYFAAKYVNGSRLQFGFIIAISLLPLCFFKYAGFIGENLNRILGTDFIAKNDWKLPLGISFITFTVIAYLVDIRRNLFAFEKSFSKFALYISFFPHLIAGPIMRPHELLPQLNYVRFRPKMIKACLLLFAIGMLKKVAVADQIGAVVDQFYAQSSSLNLPQAFLVFHAFSWQIYCDFSGYIDMAMALAFLLDVRLPLNFERPYLADSIRNFWRRWHISLSRWLRDYLYISLGGNKKGVIRLCLALATTMLLGGLWHGAAWTFVAWGAYHGIFLIIEHLGTRSQMGTFIAKVPKFLKQILTFHIVGIGWILFRSRSWQQVVDVFSAFLKPGDWIQVLKSNPYPVTVIVLLIFLHHLDRISLIFKISQKIKSAFIYAISFSIILACAALSVGNPSAFIYFDF